MSKYEESQKVLDLILKGRAGLPEIIEKKSLEFFIEDKVQSNEQHILEVSDNATPMSLKVKNPGQGLVGILPLDGTNGVFKKSSPPVSDESQFSYSWVKNMKTNETEVRTAGSCDCLIIDEKWRFLEFKTEVLGKSFNNFSYAEKVAEQNRNKAEMQLARTMTFFKEQAQGKLLNLPSPFEAVLVVNSQFPSTNSEIILRRARFITRFETDLKEVVAEGTKYEQEQSRGYLID